MPLIPIESHRSALPSEDAPKAVRPLKQVKFSSPTPSSPSGPMPPITMYSSPCPIPIQSAQRVNPLASLVPFAHKNTLQQPASSLNQPSEQSESQNVDLAISKTSLNTSLKSLGSFLGSFRETARLATRLQASIDTDTSPMRQRKFGTRRRKMVSLPNTEITTSTPSKADERSLHVLSQLRPVAPISAFPPQPKRYATNLLSQSITKTEPALLRCFTASSISLLDSARSLTQLPAAPIFTSHKTKRNRTKSSLQPPSIKDQFPKETKISQELE